MESMSERIRATDGMFYYIVDKIRPDLAKRIAKTKRLETIILGVLARQTRVATNVYETLCAAAGKPVFFFSARYDLPQTQAADGYAYMVGVERLNADTGSKLPPMVTTEAQGQWWGATGGGTTSHSFILSFLRDTTEAMLQFARLLPVEIRRIALASSATSVTK